MILKLIYYGDPLLRKKAAWVPLVTNEIKQLAKDMIETMLDAKDGVGLAAPQVGHSHAMFVLQFPDPESDERWIPGAIEVFINPKILTQSEDLIVASEGCLSIPRIFEKVARPDKVTVEAMNLNGELFTRDYEGYLARMVLHEHDHLNGILFIDRIEKKRRMAIEKHLRNIKHS